MKVIKIYAPLLMILLLCASNADAAAQAPQDAVALSVLAKAQGFSIEGDVLDLEGKPAEFIAPVGQSLEVDIKIKNPGENLVLEGVKVADMGEDEGNLDGFDMKTSRSDGRIRLILSKAIIAALK